MPEPAGPYLRAWLVTFRLLARYFRFEVDGLDVLTKSDSSLIVGYHGGPWALDMFMLAVRIYEQLGYFPRAIWLETWWRYPILRDMVTELGGLPGPPDPQEMARIRARREPIILLPGGTREAFRPFWRRHRVDFGARRGYLRLADRYGLPIIPAAAAGLDETFWGLNDGYRLSKRLFGHSKLPIWFGIGLGVWPFALPWPVKIRLRLGPPIDLRPLRAACGSEEEFLERANERVTGSIQGMLNDLLRARSGVLGRAGLK